MLKYLDFATHNTLMSLRSSDYQCQREREGGEETLDTSWW